MTHLIFTKIFRRIVSLCMVFLFALDTGNFSSLTAPTGAGEAATLSPASRINPIVSIREEDGRLTLVEDRDQSEALIKGFKEDAAFLYLSTLLAQVIDKYDAKISPEGIKALIEEHLSHVDFSRFLWKELYKEGDVYCLPYQRKDDGRRQILKYHKPREGEPFPEQVIMRFGDGVVVGLTDPFQDDGAPQNAGNSFAVLPALPKNPVIYEINARTYAKFGNITDAMLDEIKKKGADVVWLMGVWEESPFSEDMNHLFGRSSRYKRLASAYAVRDYKVNPRLGGEISLKDLVRRANARGIRVMLDMVPNHLAIDTPLAKDRPDIFMEPSKEEIDELRKRPDFARKDEFEKIYRHPDTKRFFYYGCDSGHPTPYFDTLQLDISRPETREFLREVIFKIAELTSGGGIRFDAVHLTFRQAIKDKWFPRMPQEEFDRRYPPQDEFWKNVLSQVKQKYPDIVVVSETFAGSGDIIHSLGFDYFYENFFRDKLQDGDMAALSRLFTGAKRNNYLKYLENHDINERIVSVLGKEKAIAAAALLFTTPGAALIYQGQERGCSLWVPTAALVSGPADPGSDEVAKHYDTLGKIASFDVFRNGDFTLLDAHGGLIAFAREYKGEKAMVIVNYSGREESGTVRVDGQTIAYSMRPWGYRILVKEEGRFVDWHDSIRQSPFRTKKDLLKEGIRRIDEHYLYYEQAGRLTKVKTVGRDSVFAASSAKEVAEVAARFLGSRRSPRILDLGGGNAKAACAFSLFGETTSVEIDWDLYEEGVECVNSLARSGVIPGDNIDLRQGDMWKEPFSGYDLIYIYWPFLPKVTPKMAEKLKKKLLAEADPNTILVINSVTEGVEEHFGSGRIEYAGTVKTKGGISRITAYRMKGVHRGEGTRGLPDGSPWFVCALLRQNFKGEAATAEQLVAQTDGRMPDGHLSAETVERDLATLVHLGLVEKMDNEGKAEFRAVEMSEDEWVTAEKVLIKLGSRPNAAEKQIAREELDAKLGLWKKGPSGQMFDEARISGKAGEIYEKIKNAYYRRLIMSFYGDSSNVIFDPVEFSSVFAEYCPAPTAEAKEIMSRVLAELRQEDFVEVFWGVFCHKRYFWQIRDTSGLKDKLRHVEIMAEMPQRRIPEIQLELIDYEMSNIPPQEIGDLKAASNIVNGWIRDGVIIDNTPEDFIYNVRRLHAVVARSLLGAYYEGRDITPYRMGVVESAIRPKIYPKPFDVDFFMNNLAVRVYTEEFKAMHPVLQAAEVYQRLQDIQPFEDGNKRVSKLIMDYYLMRNHLPPLEISVGNRAEFVKTVRFMKSSEEFADFLADQLASQCVLLKLRGRGMSRLCSPEETREKHLIILPGKERLYKALLDEIRKAVSGADEPVILLSPDETMMRFFASELPGAASLHPDDPAYIDISKCTLVLGAETLTTQEKYLEFSNEVLSKLPPHNTFKRIVYFNDRDVHPREAVENLKKELETLGPVTLAMAGLEAEGQLACNERMAPYNSGARIVRIKDPVRFCGDARHEHAFTVGVKDILAAKRVIVIGLTGPETADTKNGYYLSKAHAARDAIETLNVPASAVRTHKDANFVFYLDEKSAGWGAGRGFYDKSDGLFHKMDIVSINEREVEALKIDQKSGAVKVWVRADMPPGKIDVQIWTNIPEGENLANEWHSVGMAYVGTEHDGAYRFEARLIPAKEGSFAYTIRVAPKKRPLRVEWPGEWMWWKGGNKRFKVVANGNDKDKNHAARLQFPTPAGMIPDMDAKISRVIDEICKPLERDASTVVSDEWMHWNGVNSIMRKNGLRTFEEGSRPVLHIADPHGRDGLSLLGFPLKEGAENIEDLVPVVSYVSGKDGKVHIFVTPAFYSDYFQIAHMSSSINRRRLRLLRLAEMLDHETFENSPEAEAIPSARRHHEAAMRARHFIAGSQGISPYHKWAIDSLASTKGGQDYLVVLLDEYRPPEENEEQKRYEADFYKYAKSVLPRKKYSTETQRYAHHIFRVYHNGDVEAFEKLCREGGIPDPEALNQKIEDVGKKHIMNAMEGFSPDVTITGTSETTVEIDSVKGIVRKTLKGQYASFFWDVLYKDKHGPTIINGLFELMAASGFDVIGEEKYEPAVRYIYALMGRNMDPGLLAGRSEVEAVKDLFSDYVDKQLPILGSYLDAQRRLGGLIADFSIIDGRIYQKKVMPLPVYLQHLIECTGSFSCLKDRSFENKNRIARDVMEKYLDCIKEIARRGAIVLNAKLTNFGVTDNGEIVLLDLGMSSLEWPAVTKRDERPKFFITQMKLVADARRLEDLNCEINLEETGVIKEFRDKEEAARLQRRWARIWVELISGIKPGDDEELDLDPRKSEWKVERDIKKLFSRDWEAAQKEHRRITFLPTEMAEEEMLQVIMDEIVGRRATQAESEKDPEAEAKLAVGKATTQAMLDEIMIRLLSSAPDNGKVIIGIGTEWMPDKQGVQAVVAAITRLAKKKGFEDLVFVRARGEDLAAALLKEAKDNNTPLSRVIAIGGEAAIRSEAFNDLRSTESLRKALLVGVDAKGLNEESLLDIPEMVTYAVKLAFDDIDSVDSENLTAIRAGPRMWIFIPKARPMSFEERKAVYDCQLRTLTAA